MTTKDVTLFVKDCELYMFICYESLSKEEFVNDKAYFADILDEFVENENTWKSVLHYNDIVNYWWRKEGIDMKMDNKWMMDPIQLFLKKLYIGIEKPQ